MRKLGVLTAAAAFAAVMGFAGTAQAQVIFPFDDSLVGYWSFDDNTDPTNDDSGNGNDGNLESGGGSDPTFDNVELAPIASNAFSLEFPDPGSGFVEVDNESNFDFERTDSFTLAAWVKLDSAEIPAPADAFVMAKMLSGSPEGYVLFVCGGVTCPLGHILGSVQNSGAFLAAANGDTDIADDTYHHVAMVWDGSCAGPPDVSCMSLFVDGSAEGLTTFLDTLGANSVLNNAPFTIGSRDTGEVPYTGNIDDARVYDRALTAREIAQLASGISITKELLSAGHIGTPADTTLDLNENWQFVMKVTVTNNSDSTLNDLVLIDGLPGDLELGNDTSQLKRDFDGSECPDGEPEITVTQGSAEAIPTGNSSKCHVTWDIGSLTAGDSAMLTMDTSTDVNPAGLRKDEPVRFQEYTSEGPYCINQGGTLIDTVQEIVLGRSNGLQVDNGTIVSETSATINNAGFEEDALADGTADAPGVAQWISTVGTGTLNPDSTIHFSGEAPEGANVATVFAGNAILAQTLAETLTAGKTYTLEVEVGDAIDIDFPGFEVALVAGLSFPPNIIASQDENDVAVADDSFETVTVEFFASAIDPDLGEPLSILLLSDGIATFFDDVSLTITMPFVDMVEPEVCGE